MKLMTDRRELTAEELEDSARLKAIWDDKKGLLALTQEKVSEKMGWSTQSAFSQYLNGRIALNLVTVLGLAKVLEVPPEKISPTLTKYLEARGGYGVSDSADAGYALPASMQVINELRELVEREQLTDEDMKILGEIARRMKREKI
jgi:transcriptional regulator with XRE-family HTH domain